LEAETGGLLGCCCCLGVEAGKAAAAAAPQLGKRRSKETDGKKSLSSSLSKISTTAIRDQMLAWQNSN
jgi:hypothetical protein